MCVCVCVCVCVCLCVPLASTRFGGALASQVLVFELLQPAFMFCRPEQPRRLAWRDERRTQFEALFADDATMEVRAADAHAASTDDSAALVVPTRRGVGSGRQAFRDVVGLALQEAPRLVEQCIALAPLRLPHYCLLYIVDWLPRMARVAQVHKVRVIEAVAASCERVWSRRRALASANHVDALSSSSAAPIERVAME